MKHYQNIVCGVLSPIDLTDTAYCPMVMELLSRHSWILPTHVGNYEPIRTSYSNTPDALGLWADPFLWKNIHTKIRGAIWFGRKKQHSCLYVNLKPQRHLFRQHDWVLFLKDASNTLKADYGYLHLITEQEFADQSIGYERLHAIDVGITTRQLKVGIPNICWSMVFGAPYEKLVERLRHTSMQSVLTDLTDQIAYLQLTPSLFDILDNYSSFKDARLNLKRELGENCPFVSDIHNLSPSFLF